jgi:hypothetical protein
MKALREESRRFCDNITIAAVQNSCRDMGYKLAQCDVIYGRNGRWANKIFGKVSTICPLYIKAVKMIRRNVDWWS